MITFSLTVYEIGVLMFMTLVFIGAVWYLSKIAYGAAREAINEIKELRKESKVAWTGKGGIIMTDINGDPFPYQD